MVENRYFYGKSEPHVCITISYFKSFVKGRKARTPLAAPPNAKADGGVLMQVKSYATLPPGKAASMRRPVMMSPARPRPLGLTLLFLSHHLIEPSERKTDDIVIGAFYTRNQDRALALDAVRAGFIHRFTGGDVAIDLRIR